MAFSVLLPPDSTNTQPGSSAPIPVPGPSSLSISFFSAASIPLALPPAIARGFGWPQWGLGVVGVNERVGGRLLTAFSGPPSELREAARVKSRLFRKGAETAVEKQPLRERQQEELRLRGWAFIDFLDDPVGKDIVSLLVECNFRQQG